MKFDNPYTRLEEIEKRYHELEVEEVRFKSMPRKKNDLDEVQSEMMFLTFEQLSIGYAIKYFEKKIKKMKKEDSKK